MLADAESTTLYMWLGLIGWILSSTEIPTLYVLSSQAGLHAHMPLLPLFVALSRDWNGCILPSYRSC